MIFNRQQGFGVWNSILQSAASKSTANLIIDILF